MNLPNALTISRIFLAPLLVVLLLTGRVTTRETWAFVVLLAASATDYLDGYLARKRFQVTTLGKLLDPDCGQALDLGCLHLPRRNANCSGMDGRDSRWS